MCGRTCKTPFACGSMVFVLSVARFSLYGRETNNNCESHIRIPSTVYESMPARAAQKYTRATRQPPPHQSNGIIRSTRIAAEEQDDSRSIARRAKLGRSRL